MKYFYITPIEMCSTSLLFGKMTDKSCYEVIDKAWLNVLTQEYLDITPIHWLTFSPPSCLVHRLIGFLYFFLFIPGVCGNLLIIISFARYVFFLFSRFNFSFPFLIHSFSIFLHSFLTVLGRYVIHTRFFFSIYRLLILS